MWKWLPSYDEYASFWPLGENAGSPAAVPVTRCAAAPPADDFDQMPSVFTYAIVALSDE